MSKSPVHHKLRLFLLLTLFCRIRGDATDTSPQHTTRVIQNGRELREAFQNLLPHQRLILEAEVFQLTEAVVIDVPGITVEGRRHASSQTTIRCAASKHGFIVKGNETRFISLSFHRCHDRSAVTIHPKTGEREETWDISFDDVHFLENGKEGDHILGAAIRVDRCRTSGCIQPRLFLRGCLFFNNSALRGGAIFAEDTDLNIRNVTFRENAAGLTGGALYVHHRHGAILNIMDSFFENNVAHADPRLHRLSEQDLLVSTNETLMTSGMGGAIFAHSPISLSIHASNFVNNTACRGGGAVGAFHTTLAPERNTSFAFSILDSIMEGNVAYCGSQEDALHFDLFGRDVHCGGAVMYESLDGSPISWLVANSSFSRNRARVGGALSFRSAFASTVEHHLISCTFDENVALRVGGSVIVHASRLRVISTTIRNSRSIYGGGLTIWQTSSVVFSPNPDDASALSSIEGNIGSFGGGILLSNGGQLDLSSVVIRNNTAYRVGGGLCIDSTQQRIAIRGVLFEDNRSLLGGGTMIDDVMNINITSFHGQPTVFRNNSAAVGGGLYYEPGRVPFLLLNIENTEFIENRARALETAEIHQLLEDSNRYSPLPEESIRIPQLSAHLEEFSLLRFLADVEEGHGGGICLNLKNLNLFSIAEIYFQNLFMTNNTAVVGGGISAHMTDLYWNKGNRTTCFPAAFGLDTCQKFVLVNATVIENRAEFAGGVFSTLADGIIVSCTLGGEVHFNARDLIAEDLRRDPLLPYCSKVENNGVVNGTVLQGADAGGTAEYLAVDGWDGPLKTVSSGKHLAIPCKNNRNDSCSQQLRIIVRDIFNQTISRGVADASLEVVLLSKDIVGDVRYRADRGIIVINNTVAWGINVSSTLRIVNEKDPRVSLELEMSTRACYPGEINQTDLCQMCPVDQYGFIPSLGKCEACEDHAVCSGGAALVPTEGYWHSTPFSPIVRKCITADACAYEGRTEILDQYYANSQQLQQRIRDLDAYLEKQGPIPEFLDYQQCAKGHQGLLCGSCQPGYGHSYTGMCHKCPKNGTVLIILVFLSNAWLFLLIGINCAFTLLSTKTRVDLVKHETQTFAKTRPRTVERAAEHIHRSLTVTSKLSVNATDRTISLPFMDSDSQLLFAQQLIATVQLSETLKILINYLQLTSIAVRLQTDWNAFFGGFLSAQAGFAGVSSSFITAPYECNFDADRTPPSVAALWMRLATPWILLVAVESVFVICWSIRRLHTRMRFTMSPADHFDKTSLLTYVIIISIVSMYLSYISVVRELLRAVNCMRIEDEGGHLPMDHPYLAYAIETTDQKVWAEDTDLACWKGSHLPVGIVGIIGLIMALCGIISIIVWLPLNKKHVTKTEFVSRYWFIYQAYGKEWYRISWESTILARKALIAGVIVYSAHMGPGLQAALCAGILSLFHMLHSVISPFKVSAQYKCTPEYAGGFLKSLCLPKLAPRWIAFSNSIHLNTLESVSLASTIIVFYCAIVLNDASSSPIGRSLMIAFAFAVNFIFVLYMLYRLYAGLHVLVDLKLEMDHAAFMAASNNSMSPLHLLTKILALIRNKTTLCPACGSSQENFTFSQRNISASRECQESTEIVPDP